MSPARDFWSRRVAAVTAERDSAATVGTEPTETPDPSVAEAADEARVLAELNLPDPDRLRPGDDIRGFMAKAVPEPLRRRALRRLWRLNPVLANVDGLVDYGEDYTDGATVIVDMQTTYQVGKGMRAHLRDIARDPEDGPRDTADRAGPDHDDEAPAEAEAPAAAPPHPDATLALDTPAETPPAPRRMRFDFAAPPPETVALNQRS